MTPASNSAPWRESLAAYARPSFKRGLFQVATSAVPYIALCVAMYLALGVSRLVTLALADRKSVV